MKTNLQQSVIVITGASSGIGKITALQLAEKGATLVLVARRREALEAVAKACEERGSQTLIVLADVSDEKAVQRIGDRAVKAFGRIDIWINNASGYMVGLFKDTPLEDLKRLMETTFFGYVYGAKAALTQFEKQKHGILINTISLLGLISAPYLSAYCAAKFGIRGFMGSLQQEYRGTQIRICNILPPAVDTPIFHKTANYSGRAAKPLGPTYTPEQVARVIVTLAEHPRNEVSVGFLGNLTMFLYRLFPSLTQWGLAQIVKRDQFQGEKQEATSGNLYEAQGDKSQAHGNYIK